MSRSFKPEAATGPYIAGMAFSPPSTVAPQTARSPWSYFLLVATLLLPFVVLARLVDVPGGPKNGPVIEYAAAFVPATSALSLIWRARGMAGVRQLLSRVLDYRKITNKVWYLPIVLLPVVSLAVTYELMAVTGIEFPTQPALSVRTMAVFVAVYVAVAVGEELGWSGYAIEPLQQRWGAFGASVILGMIWGAFHVALEFRTGQSVAVVLMGWFGIVGARLLWVWIFNNAGGSVFAIVVVHTVSNICGAYVPTVPTVANSPVLVVFAVLVTGLWGPRTLTRYRRDPRSR